MSILSCYLMPHPPIMVPEVGKSQSKIVQDSIESAETIGKEIKDLSPDTVIVISPHGPVFQDAICLYDFPLKGSLAGFRAPEINLEYETDDKLKEEILSLSKAEKIPVVTSKTVYLERFGFPRELDHGVLVPLYFIDKYTSNFNLIAMAFGMLPYEELYAFGKLLQKAVENTKKNVVIIASGDLSHRLTPDAPAGYSPEGKIFDEKLVAHLKCWDLKSLYNLESSLVEKAGECGLRSIWIMAGSLDGRKVKPKILSYEGPFGVGYCVAKFEPDRRDESFIKKLDAEYSKNIKDIREQEDPYVKLARTTLESYVRDEKLPELSTSLPKVMLSERAGVFVTIKKRGQLRGCIGTFLPTKENIAEEIQKNAISAGCEDPRFPPIRKEELCELVYSVDVLSKPEPVTSLDQLDPKKYGVIVKKGFRRGLLLPNLEGVDTVKEQISIALQKAGISSEEKYEIERFEVKRYN